MISQIDIDDMRDETVTIEICPELAETITAQTLRNTIQSLRIDLEDGNLFNMFSMDKEEDEAKTKKFIKALVKAHNWYTLSEDHL